MKGKYSKRGKIAYQTNIIGNLVDQGNYSLAWIVIESLLPEYIDDERLKFQMVCLNLVENNYDEALSLIEDLNEERNFITKTELYIMLGKEEKEFEMYQRYFRKFNFDNPFYIQDRRYRLLYIYLNKKFNRNFVLPDFLGKNYLEQQIYSYSREETLKNIKLNHFDFSDVDKGVFYSDVDVEKIYEFADKFIRSTDTVGAIKYGVQVFRFTYPNCGVVRSNEIANGFSVIASLGTRDIIAIHPSKLRLLHDVIEYVPIREEAKKMVRVKNGLERFNERYNK